MDSLTETGPFAVGRAGAAARQMSRAALVPAPRPRAFGAGFDAP
jgi:hypothetical protein